MRAHYCLGKAQVAATTSGAYIALTCGYVRYWHKADIRDVCSMVANGAKADVAAQFDD
jgi:hypothetical protein